MRGRAPAPALLLVQVAVVVAAAVAAPVLALTVLKVSVVQRSAACCVLHPHFTSVDVTTLSGRLTCSPEAHNWHRSRHDVQLRWCVDGTCSTVRRGCSLVRRRVGHVRVFVVSQEGRAEIIANSEGSRTTASCVAFTESVSSMYTCTRAVSRSRRDCDSASLTLLLTCRSDVPF